MPQGPQGHKRPADVIGNAGGVIGMSQLALRRNSRKKLN